MLRLDWFRSPAFLLVLVVFLLEIAAFSVSISLLSIAPLSALRFAPTSLLATLPIALNAGCSAIIAIPAVAIIEHYGYRLFFAACALLGVAGALLSAYGDASANFAMIVAGNALIGVFVGSSQFYKFLAARFVADNQKEKVVTLILFSGLPASFIGSWIAINTHGIFKSEFFASYLVIASLCLFVVVVYSLMRLPDADGLPQGKSGPIPWRKVFGAEIMPGYFNVMMAQFVMALLMTVTPAVAMLCHVEFSAIAYILQWHVLAMFIPFLVLGWLMARWGADAIAIAGLLLGLAACVAFQFAVGPTDFTLSLVLVGLMWAGNYAVGMSTIAKISDVDVKPAAEGMVNFLGSGTFTLAILLSGPLSTDAGKGTAATISALVILVSAPVILWALVARLRARSLTSAP